MESPMNKDNLKDNVCVVCFRNIDIYAISNCDHYDRVCYVCSARLRVLCQKNDCPICRKDSPKIIFSEHKVPYSVLSKSQYKMDRKYEISFENETVEEKYHLLLEHRCLLCPQANVLKSFGQLKDHMRKTHEAFYCELCVEHLKLFTFERKFYNRKDLATHRRQGDTDNTSHRGHPRCQFCDQRYLDKDELYRHLRREHFFCHFCDADGYFEYYGDYNFLRGHFKDKHFLCEEENCKEEKFTSVFRSDIDLKAHVASQHGKNFTKLQAKQARTLELEFTIAPRQPYNGIQSSGNQGYDDYSGRRGRRNRGNPGRESRPPNVGERGFETERLYDNSEAVVYPGILSEPEINTHCEKEFPTLAGNGKKMSNTDVNGQKITIRASTTTNAPKNYSRKFSVGNDADFPSLEPTAHREGAIGGTCGVGGGAAANNGGGRHQNASSSANKSASNTLLFRINNNQNKQSLNASKKSPNMSIQVSSKSTSQPSQNQPPAATHDDPNGGWSFTKFVAPKCLDAEFPTLAEPAKTMMFTSAKNSCTSRMTIPIASNSAWNQNKHEKMAAVKKTPTQTEDFEIVKTKAQKKKLKNNNINNLAAMVVLSKDKTNNIAKKDQKMISEKSKKEAIERKDVSTSSSDESVDGTTLEKFNDDDNHFGALSNVGSIEIETNAAKSSSEVKKRQPKLLADDFPPLATKIQVPKAHITNNIAMASSAPPGFRKTNNLAGTSCKHEPPPGFGSNGNGNAISQPDITISLSSVARQLTTPLPSKKQQSGGLKSVALSNKAVYLTPENFEDRNRLLIQEIWEMLGDDNDGFKEFKKWSGMFRQGAMPAKEYYDQCVDCFGREKFHRVLIELLVLLPDIAKQQELLGVHNGDCKRKSKEQGTVPKSSLFMVCAACQQVLSNKDFRMHMLNHDDEEEEEELMPSPSSNLTSHITWVKNNKK